MSWLNLNQSLSSLKGQITNFATEVLSENVNNDSGDTSASREPSFIELQDKCHIQEIEIESLRKLNEELEAKLNSKQESSKRNGIKEEEENSNWYWDPSPPPNTRNISTSFENEDKLQILALEEELSTLKRRHEDDGKIKSEEELNRLTEENRSLKKNLEDLDNQHQLAMEKLLSLKKELQANFELLKQEHEDIKNSNDKYAQEIKSLLQKVVEKDKEIEDIKIFTSDYETLLHKYQNLERLHSLLRENAENFQEENQELHEEVFKLQEKVTKLEHDLEISIQRAEKEKYEDLLKELNSMKNCRSMDEVHIDEVNIDDNAKSVIENLKRELNDMKHKITLKETEEDQKNLRTDKIMHLYNKYVNFELPVDYVGDIPTPEDGVVLFKLECVFKTLNSYKKEIDALEHKLSEKELNIDHLKTQIDDLTTENDFLATDLRQVETELNETKKNNDFLISEITILKNTSKLEPIIETHEDNIVKLENELADCNRLNKNFASKLSQIEKELTNVKLEKLKLQECLTDLKNKYTSMLSELDLCRNQTNELETLEYISNNETSKKLNETLFEIDQLKKKLTLAEAKNEQLSIDIHIIENDKVLLTKEVAELKEELEKKSNECTDLENSKTTLESKLRNVEAQRNDTIIRDDPIASSKSEVDENVSISENKIKSQSSKARNKSTQTRNFVSSNSTDGASIQDITTELSNKNMTLEELFMEYNSMKQYILSKSENYTLLQKHTQTDEVKIEDQDNLNDIILRLKQHNEKCLTQKLQLKGELMSTDKKVAHLGQEFDKLLADLNKKDTIINDLNSTITQNEESLLQLNQKISDLQLNINLKNQEIANLTLVLNEKTEKLKDTSQNTVHLNEEINRLNNEKEDFAKQCITLSDELNSKTIELKKNCLRLDEVENLNIQLNNTISLKNREIKELNEIIVENNRNNDNMNHYNDEYTNVMREKESLQIRVIELNENLILKEQELTQLNDNYKELEKINSDHKTVIDNAAKEKLDLINLINIKHNESLQYHNEIQRLNAVILEQTNEFKNIVQEKENLIKNSANCTMCESLERMIKEKDDIIQSINLNLTDYEKIKDELNNSSKEVQKLSEKCDHLNKSLAVQLETTKKLSAENTKLLEQEQNLSRELERLRHHLVETEENYTQELMASEQKLNECQARLHQVEERAKHTSTLYTSNSIRANQEVETLRNQIKLLEKQREDVESRLSDAEDARSRSEAALVNLQLVLEQFQQDKEHDIETATEKIRNKMESLKREKNVLRDEIARLNVKLEESLSGLQAAARLGDQLQTKTAQISDLKDQVRMLQSSVAAAEERYCRAVSNHADKVDKELVRNLVVNYALNAYHSTTDRTQVLRVLSTVLDFNQRECERLGLVKGAAPDTGGGLAAEFVRFLQTESQPRIRIAPSEKQSVVGGGSGRNTPTPNTSTTPSICTPAEPSHKRNASSGSNNLLLQNMDSVETSSRRSLATEPPYRTLDTGVTQPRSTESAILKNALRDM